MKKYAILLSASFLCVWATSMYFQKPQDEITGEACCTHTSEAGFVSFAQDQAFVDKHEEPLGFEHQSEVGGKMISIPMANGSVAQAYFIEAAEKSNKYLFVIHEWWGLNDHIKKEADQFYEDLKGFNVLALDLYEGKVATTREDAAKYMQAAQANKLKGIVRAVLDYAGKDAEIATVGWCFGGGWSLQTALLAEDQAKACIMYYGMPEKEPGKLKTLKADVLGIFATQDQWINGEVVSDFEKAMKEAGKSLELKSYEAAHAFANPSNPKYQEDYAKDAYKRSLDFINKRMK